MDPLTLAQLLSLFPANGTLKPLQLYLSGTTTRTITTPMSKVWCTKKVADAAYTQLVTKILNDRLTGVQQFGLASSLNLSQSNYAVKTGTSQDYHDSWTIGYTPDFLVVVWYGNPDNTPLQHVTGQSGAGGVWHDAMEILLNSPYNHKTPLDTSSVREIPIEGSLDFGLAGESVADHRNLLPDNTLITSPQDCDTYLKESNTRIPLVSPEDVSWYVDGALLGTGTRVFFSPTQANDYTIKAMGPSGKSTHVIIHIISRP